MNYKKKSIVYLFIESINILIYVIHSKKKFNKKFN